jgi:hypothetical protein
VVNDTTVSANLSVMLDMDNDGFFTGAEIESSTVPAGFVGPVSVSFTPPITAPVGVRTGLRVRIASSSVASATGLAPDGEVEDYTVLFAGFDYGDLPQSFNTEGASNPPAHIISADLMLGASVDAEIDGAADGLALGDDQDAGLVTFGTSTPAGDDENGISLVSPLIPGDTAVFSVSAVNNLSAAAVLQAWIDINREMIGRV